MGLYKVVSCDDAQCDAVGFVSDIIAENVTHDDAVSISLSNQKLSGGLTVWYCEQERELLTDEEECAYLINERIDFMKGSGLIL